MSTTLGSAFGSFDLSCDETCVEGTWFDNDPKLADRPVDNPDDNTAHYKLLLAQEMKHRAVPAYLDTIQKEMTEADRSSLVQKILKTCHYAGFEASTLHLAVCYMDAALSKQFIPKNKFDIGAVTCIVLAMKHDETYNVWSIRSLTKMYCGSAGVIADEEVIVMETLVLSALDWCALRPHAYSFLWCAMDCSELDQQTRFLVQYLMDLALLQYPLLRFRYSVIAASCVLIASWRLKKQKWNDELVDATGYDARDLCFCVEAIVDACRSPTMCDTFTRNKFKDACLGGVSSIVVKPLPKSFWTAPGGEKTRRKRKMFWQ